MSSSKQGGSGQHRVTIAARNQKLVLDYLIREADLDGLVIVSEQDISVAVDLSDTCVGDHIRELVELGLVRRERTHTRGRINGIQLLTEDYA